MKQNGIMTHFYIFQYTAQYYIIPKTSTAPSFFFACCEQDPVMGKMGHVSFCFGTFSFLSFPLLTNIGVYLCFNRRW